MVFISVYVGQHIIPVTLLQIVLMLASHASLNHTLSLRAFLFLFFQLCVHQVMALAFDGMYIYVFIYYTAGREVLVHKCIRIYVRW